VKSDAEASLAFLVRHAWLSMRPALAEALTAYDLSVAQYGALACLAEEPGSTVAEVARSMASTRQSANELLGGMERAGLVERRAHPSDRRAQQVFLTRAGKARLRATTPAIQAAEDRLQAGFTVAEQATVRAWLAKMCTASGWASEEEIPTG
jgi:DNA-binding MarR family transcriptional regulator